MTIPNISDISVQMFVTVFFFLLIIAPLFSLGALRLFQSRKKAGFTLIGAGVVGYLIFMFVINLIT